MQAPNEATGDDSSEAAPLLLSGQRGPAAAFRPVIAMLLILKISHNMFMSQMINFDVMSFPTKNDSNYTGSSRDVKGSVPVAYLCVMAVASLLLPTLGGILSDAWLGTMKTIWVDVSLKLCGTAVLAILDWCDIIWQVPQSHQAKAPFRVCLGIGDTLLLYAPMMLAYDRQSRLLLISLYFIGSGSGELLGNVPGFLRHLTRQSYEYLGAIVSAAGIVCAAVLSSRLPPVLRNDTDRFFPPRSSRLRKFYLVASGIIPYFVCIKLCMYSLYWKQLQYISKPSDDMDFAASYIGLLGYQSAKCLLSSTVAVAAFFRRVPEWFTLTFRIRTGVFLMILVKVLLTVLTIVDAQVSVITRFDLSSTTLWVALFGFTICDGLADGLVTVAYYELIVCIAERTARATCIGIFYTVWILAYFLNVLLQLVLEALNVLPRSDPARQQRPSFHWAYVVVICLLLIFVAIWEKISWPLASGSFADYEEEEKARSGSVDGSPEGAINTAQSTS